MSEDEVTRAYQSGLAVQADTLAAAQKWGRDKARECRQLEAATNRTIKELKRVLDAERKACSTRDKVIVELTVAIAELRAVDGSALDAIAEHMSAEQDWSADTLDYICDVLATTGRVITTEDNDHE